MTRHREEHMRKENPISIVIICKNEKDNIRRCLESVLWADEIVVYDTGSTDNTLEICKEYDCSIYTQAKWEGFGKAKNEAVNKAKYDWILSIDADEEVSENLKNSILDILKTQNSHKAYRIKRSSYFMKKMIKYSGWQRDYTLKLFDRRYGNFNFKTVHEHVETKCEIGYIDDLLYHYTYPEIKTHIAKMIYYSELGALEAIKKNKKSNICKAIFKGIGKFIKMYFLNLGFLDGKAGFVLATNTIFYVYLKNIYIWENTVNNKSKEI